MPVYRDLYARHDLLWWSTVSFLVDDDLWAMSFLRGGTSEPFQRSDVPGLQSLGPHLARLIGLKTRLQRIEAHDAVGLLDSTDIAASVVDENLRLIAANRSAEALFGADIRVSGGHIQILDRRVERKLRELVLGMLHPEDGTAPIPVAISRFGRRPLLVDAVSFPRLVGQYFEAHAVLLFTDLDSLGVSKLDRLQTVFGLTRAEACLAQHLAAGDTLGTAADRLRIAKETGRSQLKAIFQKTGVNRQADVALLLQRTSRVGPR